MNLNQRIGDGLHIAVENAALHSDGFSFTVKMELEAYRAAYAYREAERVVVSEAPNVNAWLVQVYSKALQPTDQIKGES